MYGPVPYFAVSFFMCCWLRLHDGPQPLVIYFAMFLIGPPVGLIVLIIKIGMVTL